MADRLDTTLPGGSTTRANGLILLAATIALMVLGWAVQDFLLLPIPGDETLRDLFVRSRAVDGAGPDEPIVIVRFDDETLARLATPWAKFTPLHTRLVRTLSEGGATVIAFDLGLGFLEATDEGQRFLAECRRSGNVVMATDLATERAALQLPESVRTLPALRSLRSGFANFCAGPPGPCRRANRGEVIRAVGLTASTGPGRRLSLALEVARSYLDLEADRLAVVPGQCRLDRRLVRLEDGLLRIDYPGARYFPTIAYENVVLGKVPKTLFRGKAVLVGSYSLALRDSHQTPLGELPGVVVHASAARTLLKGSPPIALPWPVGWLMIALVGAAVGLAFARLRAALALGLSLLLPVPLYLLLFAAFRSGIFIPGAHALAAGPILGILGWSMVRQTWPARRGATIAERSTSLALRDVPSAASSAQDLLLTVARAVVSDRYSDPRLLGRGGMGIVLAAHDSTLGQDVAIKVLSPLLIDRPEALRRFMREIRTLRELDHPSVVRILEVGEDLRTPYYAMELIEGRDLKEVLAEAGRLPLDRARPLFRQLFDALAHVHRRGIIHRDIKPQNLMMCECDRLKLLDFGLARLSEATVLTQDGEILGTLRYMSPEQMNGAELDATTDIFSSALVAFEALTGTMPFPDLGKILNHTVAPTPLVDRRPDAPAALSALLSRCLSADRCGRPASCEEVLEEWDRLF
ncbi:MAG: CHASE2 domain-containing protein [Candidatus Riflebacteria bacterium]|nr:CHASE2 domain-containing protein [Candidatus Riflebacteria bacterium]